MATEIDPSGNASAKSAEKTPVHDDWTWEREDTPPDTDRDTHSVTHESVAAFGEPPAAIEGVSEVLSGHDAAPLSTAPETSVSAREAYESNLKIWKQELYNSLFTSETSEKETAWLSAALDAAEAAILQSDSERSRADFITEVRTYIEQHLRDKELPVDATADAALLGAEVAAAITHDEGLATLETILATSNAAEATKPVDEKVGNRETPLAADKDAHVESTLAAPTATTAPDASPQATSNEAHSPTATKNGNGNGRGEVVAKTFVDLGAVLGVVPSTSAPEGAPTPTPLPRDTKAKETPAAQSMSPERTGEQSAERNKELVKKINEIGVEIKSANQTITECKKMESQKAGNPKEINAKRNKAEQDRRRLLEVVKKHAVEIAGFDSLSTLVRAGDRNTMELSATIAQLPPKVARLERDKVEDFRERRGKFIALLPKEVDAGVASMLRKDFVRQAEKLTILHDKLLRRKDKDTYRFTPTDTHLLRWYGIEKGETLDALTAELGGIVETQNATPVRKELVLAPKEQERKTMASLSQNKLKEHVAGDDEALRASAEAELGRRALRISRRRGTDQELTRALIDIESGNGAKVDEKWLIEFQGVPVIGRYYLERKAAVPAAPVTDVVPPVTETAPAPAVESDPHDVPAPIPAHAETEPVAAISSTITLPHTPEVLGDAFATPAELTPEQKIEFATALNELRPLLDAQYAQRRNPEEHSKFDPAEVERINRLAEETASKLVAPEQLRSQIKVQDKNWRSMTYKELGDNLNPNQRAEYFVTEKRRDAFKELLIEAGVEKDMAGVVYRRFMEQASSLEQISHQINRLIEAGRPCPVLTAESADFRTLRMHGVPAELITEGKLAEILAIIAPQVDEYAHIREPKAEGTPIEQLVQSYVNLGKEYQELQFRTYAQFKDVPEIQSATIDKVHALIASGDTKSLSNLPEWVDALMSGDTAYTEYFKNLPKISETPSDAPAVSVPEAVASLDVTEKDKADTATITDEQNAMLSDSSLTNVQRTYLTNRHEIIDGLRKAQMSGNQELIIEFEGELERMNAWYNAAAALGGEEKVETAPLAPNTIEAILPVSDAYWSAFEKNLSPSIKKIIEEMTKGMSLEPMTPRTRAEGVFDANAVPLTERAKIDLEVPVPTDRLSETPDISLSFDGKIDFDPTLPSGESVPTKPIERSISSRFEKSFRGITAGDLELIPGFANLREGRQLLVLKNLQSMVFDKVKNDARDTQAEEWKNTGLLMKTLQQIWHLGTKPEKRVAELEKELAKKQRVGSGPDGRRFLAENLISLTDLVKVAASGPEVEAMPDGNIKINYASKEATFGVVGEKTLTGENLLALERYNSAADEFAKYPHEWGYEADDSRVGFFEKFSPERKKYNKARVEYDTAREGMFALYLAQATERAKQSGDQHPDRTAALQMNKIDEQVELNQLFNTHPDAEKALLEIEDQSVMKVAMKEFWKTKGTFIAYGAVARAAAVAVSGGIALPAIFAIGAGVGVGIGREQAKRLIKQRRIDGRMSQQDLREIVEYPVFEKEDNKTGKVKIDEQTGERKILRYERRPLKEYTDATFFIDRIERLTNKLEQVTVPAERELLEKKIVQTVTLMKEKKARGMINFGGSSLEKSDERKGATSLNRLDFTKAIARGEFNTTIDRREIENMIHDAAAHHQGRIEEVRGGEVWRAAGRSSLIRGVGALGAGYLAQEFVNPHLKNWFGMDNRADVLHHSARPATVVGAASTAAPSVAAHAASAPTPPHPASGPSLHSRMAPVVPPPDAAFPPTPIVPALSPEVVAPVVPPPDPPIEVPIAPEKPAIEFFQRDWDHPGPDTPPNVSEGSYQKFKFPDNAPPPPPAVEPPAPTVIPPSGSVFEEKTI